MRARFIGVVYQTLSDPELSVQGVLSLRVGQRLGSESVSELAPCCRRWEWGQGKAGSGQTFRGRPTVAPGSGQ